MKKSLFNIIRQDPVRCSFFFLIMFGKLIFEFKRCFLSQKCMYTAFLSVEIWRESWSYCGRTELEILSRTCHLFHEIWICLPMLFADIRNLFKSKMARWADCELWSLWMFVSSMTIERLATSPKHAPLLRRWEVSIIERTTFLKLKTDLHVTKFGYRFLKASPQSYVDSVSQNLSVFTGLRTIKISHLKIGEVTLSVLKGLPALEILICVWTTFSLSCYNSSPTTS